MAGFSTELSGRAVLREAIVRHAGKFAIPDKRVVAVALWGNLRGEEIVTEKGLVGN